MCHKWFTYPYSTIKCTAPLLCISLLISSYIILKWDNTVPSEYQQIQNKNKFTCSVPLHDTRHAYRDNRTTHNVTETECSPRKHVHVHIPTVESNWTKQRITTRNIDRLHTREYHFFITTQLVLITLSYQPTPTNTLHFPVFSFSTDPNSQRSSMLTSMKGYY